MTDDVKVSAEHVQFLRATDIGILRALEDSGVLQDNAKGITARAVATLQELTRYYEAFRASGESKPKTIMVEMPTPENGMTFVVTAPSEVTEDRLATAIGHVVKEWIVYGRKEATP